jgi:hypothetical protein
MLGRRNIKADSRGRMTRLALGIPDLARWPFERLAWAFERGLLWPMRERFAGWRPSSGAGLLRPSGRVAGAAALGAVAVAAVAAGLLLSSGPGGNETERLATPRVALATPAAAKPSQEESSGPVLHGAKPSFGVADGVDVGEAASGAGRAPAAAAKAGRESGETAEEAVESLAGEGAASASSAKPVPAGPAAMKVARRFADAFVFYEIGERPARARAVFAETATPQLAEALAERPPRLPQDAEVPKAKVLNLVPGPRHGKAYTISASLLRVGLTSELRLEIERQKGEWLVTDVRG